MNSLYSFYNQKFFPGWEAFPALLFAGLQASQLTLEPLKTLASSMTD
jgi:hypothetical protein